MPIGLVMEGGAMRGLFTAGVLDVLLENGIVFDGGIGVSAGACFGCNYKSKQAGRAVRYNLRFCKEWRYSSFRSWLTTGDVFGAKFCYHDIPEKLDPFDCATYDANPMRFFAVCTDIETGEPIYHECPTIDANTLLWFQASASMPLVSRIVHCEGLKLLDGGMSDSIPLKAMEDLGFERNVVILTQPLGYVKGPNPLTPLLRLIYRKYPRLVEAIANRHNVYNAQTAYVEKREKEKVALVLRPPQKLPTHHVDHDENHLRAAYNIGRQVAEEQLPNIREFVQGTSHKSNLPSQS